MSKREWKLFVEDILESLELIEKYIRGKDFEDFQDDRKTIDAVVRNLEIIGEAAKFIPEEMKMKYTHIDWKGIVGLRNRIAHEYFGLSLSVIWRIINEEFKPLKKQIQKLSEETDE